MLYTAWKNEDDLKGDFSTYCKAFEHQKSTIYHKMSEYEHVSEDLLHEAQAAYDNEQQSHTDDAVSGETEEGLCEAIPQEDQFDIGPTIGLPPISSEPEVELRPKFLPDHDFYALVKTLNRKQQEFYTHITHLAIQGNEQVLCALHGGAGTGKSHVIKAIYQGLQCICNK